MGKCSRILNSFVSNVVIFTTFFDLFIITVPIVGGTR